MLKYFIERIDGKFYVFGADRAGNKYDTMYHFRTMRQAKLYIIQLLSTEKGE